VSPVESTAAKVPPRRRRGRRIAVALLVTLAGYATAMLLGMPVAAPYDLVMNLGDAPVWDDLRAPADGRRRVVVLQHGILRSPLSFGRLERALAAHGYEVHNLGYPSTRATIEQHAVRLHDGVEAIFARGAVHELAFVGHSMGGLVVQEYLRRPDARPTAACVYLATPHRGAVLADLRRNWFAFRWVMGTTAADQLSPQDPLHLRPIPVPERSATIVGDVGAGNASIPGADDGTVAVAEATFPGAAATVALPVGHTAISRDPEVIRRVLEFLLRRGFAAAGAPR
jgi:triacylglycerol lipase